MSRFRPNPYLVEWLWCAVGLACAVLLALGDGNKKTAAKEPISEQMVDFAGDPLPPGAIARFGGSLRLRHAGPVTFVSFLADGKTILAFSSYSEKGPRFWKVADGREIANPITKVVRSFFVVSQDGHLLANCGDDHIEIWDLTAEKLIRTIAAKHLLNPA